MDQPSISALVLTPAAMRDMTAGVGMKVGTAAMKAGMVGIKAGPAGVTVGLDSRTTVRRRSAVLPPCCEIATREFSNGILG